MNKSNADLLSAGQWDKGRAASQAALFENAGRYIHAKCAVIENRYKAESALNKLQGLTRASPLMSCCILYNGVQNKMLYIWVLENIILKKYFYNRHLAAAFTMKQILHLGPWGKYKADESLEPLPSFIVYLYSGWRHRNKFLSLTSLLESPWVLERATPYRTDRQLTYPDEKNYLGGQGCTLSHSQLPSKQLIPTPGRVDLSRDHTLTTKYTNLLSSIYILTLCPSLRDELGDPWTSLSVASVPKVATLNFLYFFFFFTIYLFNWYIGGCWSAGFYHTNSSNSFW